ncbi:MAG: hypothetical protein AB1513_01210 [Pseudomonadota bacterium]
MVASIRIDLACSTKMKNRTDLILSIVSLALFLAMALLGWDRLGYGMNMRDPGMHLVDGWRLIAGDNLFPDSAMSAIQLYGVFNAAIFSIAPDISLLALRKLAFTFNLLSIVLFGAAVYVWTRKLWPIFLALSPFVFVFSELGQNLSYHGYPRLFLITHLALLIFAFVAQRRWVRNAFLLISGLALWGVGFSFLPLLPTLISPILLWVIVKYFRLDSVRFSFAELCLLVTPSLVLWAGFLIGYYKEFAEAIQATYLYVKEGGSVAQDHGPVWPYLVVTGLLSIALIASWRLPVRIFSVVMVFAATAVYFIIDTNFFGSIKAFKYDPFFISIANWFFAALFVLGVLVIIFLIRQIIKESTANKNNIFLLILLIPSYVFGVFHGIFSTRGILQFNTAAIPIVMAITLYFLWVARRRLSETVSAFLLIMVIAPIYFHLTWSNWSVIRSDAPLKHLTYTIEEGFAKGIKTNKLYAGLIQWMEHTANQYSAEGDLAIVFDSTPMGYMLIKRRPALNHSWSGWGGSKRLRIDAMNDALQRNRLPRIAYRFIRLPVIIHPPEKNGPLTVAPTVNYSPDDPVSNYVMSQMRLVDVFSIKGEPWVELYVRP